MRQPCQGGQNYIVISVHIHEEVLAGFRMNRQWSWIALSWLNLFFTSYLFKKKIYSLLICHSLFIRICFLHSLIIRNPCGKNLLVDMYRHDYVVCVPTWLCSTDMNVENKISCRVTCLVEYFSPLNPTRSRRSSTLTCRDQFLPNVSLFIQKLCCLM